MSDHLVRRFSILLAISTTSPTSALERAGGPPNVLSRPWMTDPLSGGSDRPLPGGDLHSDAPDRHQSAQPVLVREAGITYRLNDGRMIYVPENTTNSSE
ncbi:DUF2149 domain-containing protein [Phyllobacteriaceae bacterium JZ32]